MNKNLSLKSLNISHLFSGALKKYGRHLVFVAIIAVLLSYILVVLKISHLASAEPDNNQSAAGEITIPKVDQKTINHIQKLESNNTQLHALFEDARNNPFEE